MAEKQISNPGQAFALGASWGTPSVDNAMTTEIANLINGTGLILYTGDVVCLDATGTQAILASGAADTTVIGTVGSSVELGSYPSGGTFPTIASGINMTAKDGSVQPLTDVAWVTASMGFTNGSATITYASASTNDIGKYILTPYNATTNLTPQIFLITAATANTNYTGQVVAGPGTTFSGTTGAFTVQMGRDYTARGPGWSPLPAWTTSSAFPPNVTVPCTIRGFGRVNINAVAGTVRGDLLAASGANVIAARTAAAGAVAAGIGSFFGVALEAYAARDTTLTAAGIAGHDSVRALIGRTA